MNINITITQSELLEILLGIAPVRPVFIWGAPGIGKSSIVEAFAVDMGLECVSLLGSQLAPEDIIGVPQIIDGKSVFCPPRIIARDKPYCLFLDELNACSQEVQKAFYSLIHDRRIGEYHLPEGSIIIGAGNRAQDNAIVKPMSSALVNRMFHVALTASHRDWLEWAGMNNIHPYILEYIGLRPDHLWKQPPKTEEPFSTPRSWHMLSDALHSFGENVTDEQLEVLASGCLSPNHSVQFRAFIKQLRNRYWLHKIRKAMVNPNRSKLSGTVEVDETFIGGVATGKRGRGAENKVLVIIATEFDGKKLGRCRMEIIEDGSAESIHPFIVENIEMGSTLITDGWKGYNGIEKKNYIRNIHVQTG